ncbi:sensor histidine kinase [Ideonella sp. DXS22W]|uniref:Sensor histidine kinase n=1 Tax=Pseudaquabacterium inlustre TaxID=2984192 RepID=A0ABU9CC83_9BURK
MHSTLLTIFESLNSGFIWMDREARVRYVNTLGCTMTGLQVGGHVPAGPLMRAVQATLEGHATMPIRLPNANGDGSTLKIDVMPGLSRDDTMAFVEQVTAPTGEAMASAAAPSNIGLENLLTVIRTDLAEPWQRCAAAMREARDADDMAAMAPLMQELDSVGAILSKLIDLAQIWSSGSLLADDRIEIWELLRSTWETVQPLANHRNVKVRFTRFPADAPLSCVYGSESWLRRVLVECLEAELRAAQPGATVDIEYHQQGQRIMVVFRDSGMFAPSRSQSTMLSAGTATARIRQGAGNGEPPHARDLIGQHLCRQIVELHGGHLREEIDDDVRNFLIDLPAGAPVRSMTPEIDIQQAQQYARDLAALMARRRTKTAAATASPAKE